ncbi:hypothetical protein EKO27_g6753 [Xylaria grammica]|uniref:CDP-diacylglycerol--serine O-phosphatidyltransferase n=1 Tax=Xylaria grammica TaxID=363999 RepID=A0A439D1R6_9PEZI|nr:hypothetical protein EKO27_g6753 [Xylaria grammica]
MSKRTSTPSNGGASKPAAGNEPSYDKQKALLGSASTTGHFSLLRALHMADYITELNGACGILSVFSSLRYCLGDPSDKSNLYIALAFLPFGLFFDFMDGRVARWRKKSSMMGQELDSLADLHRVAHDRRPRVPHALRALRPHTPRPLQRHGG